MGHLHTNFRERVAGGERLVGTVLSLPGAAYAELIASAFEFVWIDLEHAALGLADMQDAVIGAQASGCAALARVPAGGPLAPCLDAGVDGVVIPRVDSAEAARACVAQVRYPPDGSRGYGPRRALLRRPSGPPACIVQIESRAGVQACARIAAVDGVDALVVGAGDLSCELGVPGDADAPAVAGAMAAVRDAALGAGKAFGVAGVASWPLAGATLLTIGSDLRLIADALRAAARRATPDRERDT